MYQNEGDQQEELQKLDVDYVASFQRDAKKAQPKRRKAYNSTESAKEIVISRPYSDDEEGSLEVVPSTSTAETTTEDENKTAASTTPSDESGSEGAVTENKHAVVANLKKTGNEPKRKKPRVSAASSSSESPSSSSESDEIVPFDELHLQRCTDPAQLKSWWEGEVEADCKLQFWDGKILKV